MRSCSETFHKICKATHCKIVVRYIYLQENIAQIYILSDREKQKKTTLIFYKFKLYGKAHEEYLLHFRYIHV